MPLNKQTINLGGGDRAIVIETDGKGGGSMTIVGTGGVLREACPDCGSVDCERTCPKQAARRDPETDERLLFNAAVHGVESLLLALACEGVNVEKPQFAKALETVLDQLGNRYG
ncbi:MAG: hypothetical protein ABSH08_04580 [Tepidisphaeraceae bacterium]|jgi:NAD-dependent dihydropyrimidine dehydrogenase PreA subunit